MLSRRRWRVITGLHSFSTTSLSLSTMMSTRIVGLGAALRRSAFQPSFGRNQVVLRNVAFKRGVQTESLRPEQAADFLNAQRLKRPSSPHFTIYQPQLTWFASIANRITGVGLTVLLYGFSISYVAAPYLGVPFTSADVVQLVSAAPESLKVAGKLILAAPFTFHSFNGLRHLGWDTGFFLSLKGCYRSGYTVLGATAVTTIALLFV